MSASLIYLNSHDQSVPHRHWWILNERSPFVELRCTLLLQPRYHSWQKPLITEIEMASFVRFEVNLVGHPRQTEWIIDVNVSLAAVPLYYPLWRNQSAPHRVVSLDTVIGRLYYLLRHAHPCTWRNCRACSNCLCILQCDPDLKVMGNFDRNLKKKRDCPSPIAWPWRTSLLMGAMNWDMRRCKSPCVGSCQYWAWTKLSCTAGVYAISSKSRKSSQNSLFSGRHPGKPNTPWCWASIVTRLTMGG